jgi:hypothetical protein
MTADERMAKVLVEHQRRDAGSCLCGWSQWGASHAEHQWQMLRLAGAEARCRHVWMMRSPVSEFVTELDFCAHCGVPRA